MEYCIQNPAFGPSDHRNIHGNQEPDKGSIPAGKHTLMLPKGYLQVLGFTAAETKVRNAGLAGDEETMDWLFY